MNSLPRAPKIALLLAVTALLFVHGGRGIHAQGRHSAGTVSSNM